MLKFFSALLLLIISAATMAATTINPIIGDASYFAIIGHAPSSQSEERTRIMCHLLYAEFILRMQDVSHLNVSQQANRDMLLDELHTYALKGEFPQNFDHTSERKPCFIDENGTVCAVGRLVEVSEGLAASQAINQEYKYAEVFDMNPELLQVWAEENGLSLLECAIIQPTYRWKDRKTNSIEAKGLISWRPLPQLFFGAQLMYYAFKFPDRGSNRMAAIGLEYQNLKNSDFSAQLKLLYGLSNSKVFMPYIGINPEFYNNGGRGGMNLVPEIGVRTQLGTGKFYVSANAYYGYHARLANSENYTKLRNEFGISLGLGWTVNSKTGYSF